MLALGFRNRDLIPAISFPQVVRRGGTHLLCSAKDGRIRSKGSHQLGEIGFAFDSHSFLAGLRRPAFPIDFRIPYAAPYESIQGLRVSGPKRTRGLRGTSHAIHDGPAG